MKRFVRLAALVAVIAAATPAAAQSAAPGRFGIGIGLPTSEIATLITTQGRGGIVTPQVYFPVNVTPSFRIEPQVGVLTFHDDASGDNLSYKSVGAGVFYVAPLGGNVGLYVGPRFIFSFFNEKNVGGGGVVTKTSGTDFLVAGALGGELTVHPRFSVGAEGQFGFTNIGERDVDVNGIKTTEKGGSSWSTQGILFVRIYLL